MEWDLDKVDKMVLGVLYLPFAGDHRAWKSNDWDALERLRAKEHISDRRARGSRWC